MAVLAVGSEADHDPRLSELAVRQPLERGPTGVEVDDVWAKLAQAVAERIRPGPGIGGDLDAPPQLRGLKGRLALP